MIKIGAQKEFVTCFLVNCEAFKEPHRRGLFVTTKKVMHRKQEEQRKHKCIATWGDEGDLFSWLVDGGALKTDGTL